MKDTNRVFRFIAAVAAAIICFVSCDETEGGGETLATFGVELKEAGPGYVDLNVNVSAPLEVAYSIGTSKRNISNPTILFASGKKATVNPEETFRVYADIQGETEYFLYIAAKLNADAFSEIFEINFTTPEFTSGSLLTVVGVDYDGYKMNIKVPASVKDGGSAIRFNQSDLMMYNYMTKYNGTDDYYSLIYNAGEFTTEDYIKEYSHAVNWEQSEVDVNEDGKIDENDLLYRWNPISPGEPVVFIAGEFEWMEIPADFNSDLNYEVNGFSYPAGWKPGYYLPCLDGEKYWNYINGGGSKTKSMNIIQADVITDIDEFWTGAFERKIFRVREPEKMEAKVKVSATDIGPVNATVIIEPEKGVDQFAYGIFDDSALNQMLELCDGKEAYLQWAVSSFFSMYNFGTRQGAGYTEIQLTDIFYDVPANSNINVLVTAMGDPTGASQSFTKYTFKTLEKSIEGGPEIIVTPLPEQSSPNLAAFNIKCTTYTTPKVGGKATRVYYGANYKKDFIMEVNRGSSYLSLAQSQQFSKDEVEKINSPEGYTITIPSIDGETTRLAVAAFNEENTPNNFNFKDIKECPAVADLTTPWKESKKRVISDLYDVLKGEWTATAKLLDGSTHTSKVNLSTGFVEGVDYPKVLPDSVYTIYQEEAKYERSETDAYFAEFKHCANEYNDNRIMYQNNILMTGWIDKDKYGRLAYQSPWDLFISREYSGVDVNSMFSDYGPKLYIEVSEGDKLSITSDVNFMPPVSYVSIPYYMAGYNVQRTASEGNIVLYYDNYAPITFPVELSEDKKTLKIKPIVDIKNETWFPNIVGVDPLMGYQLDYPIVSEITLTKGWNGNTAKTYAASKYYVPAKVGTTQVMNKSYKPMTRFDKPEQVKRVSGSVMTKEKALKNMEKTVERLYKLEK